MDLDPYVRAYYDQGKEAERLFSTSVGPLERERTKELISRELPSEPCRILDVGGGPGAYARWLVELGHVVELIDPVPLHVEQASEAGVDARVGDARQLEAGDGTVDVVLLLGPLYHLIEAEDRRTTLAEAHRVLRPGGLLFAAAISRYAALFDLLVRLDELDRERLDRVAEVVRTGRLEGKDTDVFTTAYFHLPSDLRREVDEAGFVDTSVRNVEGPGFVVHDLDERWADAERRAILLDSARLVESEPEMMGAAGHLLATARRATT
jgi:SAM-dependent methyltransferase